MAEEVQLVVESRAAIAASAALLVGSAVGPVAAARDAQVPAVAPRQPEAADQETQLMAEELQRCADSRDAIADSAALLVESTICRRDEAGAAGGGQMSAPAGYHGNADVAGAVAVAGVIGAAAPVALPLETPREAVARRRLEAADREMERMTEEVQRFVDSRDATAASAALSVGSAVGRRDEAGAAGGVQLPAAARRRLEAADREMERIAEVTAQHMAANKPRSRPSPSPLSSATLGQAESLDSAAPWAVDSPAASSGIASHNDLSSPIAARSISSDGPELQRQTSYGSSPVHSPNDFGYGETPREEMEQLKLTQAETAGASREIGLQLRASHSRSFVSPFATTTTATTTRTATAGIPSSSCESRMADTLQARAQSQPWESHAANSPHRRLSTGSLLTSYAEHDDESTASSFGREQAWGRRRSTGSLLTTYSEHHDGSNSNNTNNNNNNNNNTNNNNNLSPGRERRRSTGSLSLSARDAEQVEESTGFGVGRGQSWETSAANNHNNESSGTLNRTPNLFDGHCAGSFEVSDAAEQGSGNDSPTLPLGRVQPWESYARDAEQVEESIASPVRRERLLETPGTRSLHAFFAGSLNARAGEEQSEMSTVQAEVPIEQDDEPTTPERNVSSSRFLPISWREAVEDAEPDSPGELPGRSVLTPCKASELVLS
ncbi:unnamed protein product [Polarella glacialis]|uniref:Uncharacterized protein n=1 Tax=Polarella glacialis TaxID=89957 RepID=A0A813LFM5_POLGL|nr:unnamed protein product [Polarella glacialis]